jgi:hypothetical protein
VCLFDPLFLCKCECLDVLDILRLNDGFDRNWKREGCGNDVFQWGWEVEKRRAYYFGGDDEIGILDVWRLCELLS